MPNKTRDQSPLPPPPPDAQEAFTSASTSQSRAVWHYERDGQQVGPFQLEEIRVLADQGLITPTTLLIHENGTRMSAAKTTLFDIAPSPPAPSPPPDAATSTSEDDESFMALLGEGVRLLGGFLMIPIAILVGRWLLENVPPRSEPQQTIQMTSDRGGDSATSTGGLEPSTAIDPPSETKPRNRSTTGTNYGFLLERTGKETASEDSPYNKPLSDEDKAALYRYELLSRDDNYKQRQKREQPQFRYNYDFLLERSEQGGKHPPGRLKLSWSEATQEIRTLLGQMTSNQKSALGIAKAEREVNIYGLRIQLVNPGQRPVKVAPAKLRVKVGQKSKNVLVAADPRFLQPTLLREDQSVSGIVMLTTRDDLAEAIRLKRVKVIYEDSELEVSY